MTAVLFLPTGITAESTLKFMRIMETIANLRSYLSFDKEMSKEKRGESRVQRTNPLTPKISLVILLTVCHIILVRFV